MTRCGRALDRSRRALRLTPDGPGFVRLAACLTLAYAALAFVPDRTQRVAREAAAWAAVLVLLGLQELGRRQVLASPVSCVRRIAFVFPWVVVAAAFVWPFHSADVYLYANAGHLEARYGLDPYVHVPSDVAGWRADPAFTDLWSEQAFPYGFLFAHLCQGIAVLAGGRLAWMVALFKAVNALALALAGRLLWTTSQRLGRDRPDVSLGLLLASPFLLVHHVANAHNDLLLGVLVLLALRWAVDGRAAASGAALAAAGLVKLVAAAALPFLLVFLARRHGRRAALLAGISGALAVAIVSWPYARDLASFRWRGILEALTSPAYSLPAALLGLWRFLAGTGGDAARRLLGIVLGTVFLLFLVLRTRRALRRPDYAPDDLIGDAVLSMIVLACLASARYGAWYPAMFLPAALLLPVGSRLRRLSLLLAASGLVGITFVGRARILDGIVLVGVPFLLDLWLARGPGAPASMTGERGIASPWRRRS